MTVQAKLSSLETRLSSVLGGATTVSNPAENASDPLVQLALAHAIGLHELETMFQKSSTLLDIRTSPCADLDKIGLMLGVPRNTNAITSKTLIVISGVSDTTVNSLPMVDSKGVTWSLQSPVKIIDGFGVGIAVSPQGKYVVDTGELVLTGTVGGVTAIRNYQMVEVGYLQEDCDSYRARLMGKSTFPLLHSSSTGEDLLESLRAISDYAYFIDNAPACISPVTSLGIVVRGGDDQDIADIIRKLSPFNYLRLAGNTSVAFDSTCDSVRFIRPYPAAVDIQYWSKNTVDDATFVNAMCKMHKLDIVELMKAIPCLNGISIKVTPPYEDRGYADGECEAAEDAISCGGTVSIRTNDCMYAGVGCPTPTFGTCFTLKPWEYPAFASATRMGETC